MMSLAFLLLDIMQAQPEALPADSFPVIEALPDPFLFQDGRRVRTLEDWQLRRDEMRELILRYQYGHVPPSPGNVRVAEEVMSEKRYGGELLHKKVRLTMGPDNALKTTVHLYIPQTGTPPYPVVLRVGLGHESVTAMKRFGYAFACFEHRELDPDTEGRDEAGPAQLAYPEYDWGSIAVWAWGASRVLDYLVTLPEINAEQAVITGHSRTGKAAILAGALDERFAIVVPNGSGCGGAGNYRILGENCETLKAITLASRWKSWFHKDFGQFTDKESRLPFDQHFLRALVAPRPILSTDGLDDTWANPHGTAATWMAAQPVFDFLGVPRNNAIHFRPGGHDQSRDDYQALLEFADMHFRGKATSRDFWTLPFADLKPTWSWKPPAPARQ